MALVKFPGATALLVAWHLLAMALPVRADEAAAPPVVLPPGTYQTSWVGNSFGGDGGANGFGYWVQNAATKIQVTPDGTVVAGADWDEAGRCLGLYKDGRCNRVLAKDERGKETAWGWNTANHALAVDGDQIFIANTGKRLLRFNWKPGDVDSAVFRDDTQMPEAAIALSARGHMLVVGYSHRVELRRTDDLHVISSFDLADVGDVVIAPDESLWAISGQKIVHLRPGGDQIGMAITGVAKPVAVSFDNEGRLIVCDDGPDQQIKFFDVAGEPKLSRTFGDRGGILAGTPGEVSPTKLFCPRGAGTDHDGNLYIAMGYSGAPVGNLVIRSFTPAGKPRWEVMSMAFVDTFGFDPDSDGRAVYSRTASFDLDLSRDKPGSEWRLRAMTLDPVNEPKDPRLAGGVSATLRRLNGRRVLYTIGQYAGGYNLYTFDEPGGNIARPAGDIRAKKEDGEQWAWDVDSRGDIWHGDAPNRQIRRYAFAGWSSDNKPRYDWSHPQTWTWPDDFESVRRIIYVASSDTLYLLGYLKGQAIDSWGVVGFTCRRYDGWLAGNRGITWTNTRLPRNPKGSDQGGPLSACSVCIAGDYLFFGMVKPEDGKQYVHILRIADGSYAGSFAPGSSVGGNAGWEDMPYAITAMQRRNGDYLVLVEEDWRGKNLLYRWKPQAAR